jgi:nucleoside-diphosphate-sugar epimerase
LDALILGGTRNLGPGIVDALRREGHRVTVLNRGVTPDDLPREVERLRADRSDRGALAQALLGRTFDAVVDTTLYNGPDAASLAEILDGRVGRYVFVSTGQVVRVRGDLPRPFGEEAYPGTVAPPPPAGARDHGEWRYGKEKRDAEDALARAGRERGFPCTVLRLPMVNSERDHYARVRGYLARLRDGGPILIPDGQHLPLRHVYGGDVVRAILAALAEPRAVGRAYNVSQEETVTIDDFLTLLASLAGCEARTRRIPRAHLERHGLLPDCSPFSDPWMSELDNRRSKAELRFEYTPLPRYLQSLVADDARGMRPTPEGYRRRPEEIALAAAV